VKRPNSYAIAINVGPYKLLKQQYRSRYGNVVPIEFWHLEAMRSKRPGLPRNSARRSISTRR
jgi:hypothetical protein